MTHQIQPTAHAEITAPISADLRRIDDSDAKSAPITLMTEDRACTWAWDQVQQDVGAKGWTAGDSCTFYGFFLWGWNYRGQYETQRSAAPPAPAAVAVPSDALESVRVLLRVAKNQSNKASMAHAIGVVQAEVEKAAARITAAPAQAAAWMTPEGDRVVTESTMAGARKDGGAMLSSLRPFTVALGRIAAQPTQAQEDARDAERVEWAMNNMVVHRHSHAFAVHVLNRSGTGDLGDCRTYIDAARAAQGGPA